MGFLESFCLIGYAVLSYIFSCKQLISEKWYPSHDGLHVEEVSLRVPITGLSLHPFIVPLVRSDIADVHRVSTGFSLSG